MNSQEFLEELKKLDFMELVIRNKKPICWIIYNFKKQKFKLLASSVTVFQLFRACFWIKNHKIKL